MSKRSKPITGKTVEYLRAPLDRPHTFKGPQRDLSCTLVRATLYHDGDRPAGFELDARFDYSVYLAAFADRAFDLSTDNQGATMGGEHGLQDGQPVTMTLFLRHDLLRSCFSTASAFGAEANQVLAAIATPDDPLARSDAWIFVSVMQDIPGHSFQAGFKHKSYEGLDAHLLL